MDHTLKHDAFTAVDSIPGGTILEQLDCRAILFDLDGVLVDSRRAVESSWKRWAAERGVHNDELLKLAHGRRTVESVPEIAPHLDVDTEVALLERIEAEETNGLSPIKGALELLQSLNPAHWAIVTSGSAKVALARMRYCTIPTPKVFVTALDVQNGKPAPDGYLLAAKRLGFSATECVVIEDTRAGIASGKSAGAKVIAVEGTELPGTLGDADIIVKRLSDIRANQHAGGTIRLLLGDASGEDRKRVSSKR